MAFKYYRSEPMTEREKAARRRALGIVKPHSVAQGPKPHDAPKERDYLAPIKEGFVPSKPRGRSGTMLSPAKRAMVELRRGRRAEFFASLGVKV